MINIKTRLKRVALALALATVSASVFAACGTQCLYRVSVPGLHGAPTAPAGRIVTISPAFNGYTSWNLDTQGPLKLATAGTWTVTPNATMTLALKLWGAGGGGGGYDATQITWIGNGGGGSYVSGTYQAAATVPITAIVGGGGGGGLSNTTGTGAGAGGFNAGGAGAPAGPLGSSGAGGGGGGLSELLVNATDIACAAGGGGGAGGGSASSAYGSTWDGNSIQNRRHCSVAHNRWRRQRWRRRRLPGRYGLGHLSDNRLKRNWWCSRQLSCRRADWCNSNGRSLWPNTR
jgi:hypothetical protein